METSIDLPDVFEQKPNFHSKNAIAIWTFFISPLLGCILFALNLKNIGTGKLGLVFIIGSIAWIIGLRKLTSRFLQNDLVILLITNFSASLLLTFFYWNRLLGTETEYKTRPVWKPVLIFLGICIFLLVFNLLDKPEVR